MFDYTAISINPGTVFYNFNMKNAKHNFSKWVGSILDDEKDSLVFSTDNYRINISNNGMIIIFLYNDDVNVFKEVFSKVQTIYNENSLKIKFLNIHWTDKITECKIKKFERYFYDLFTNSSRITTIRLKSGKYSTIIESLLKVSL